MAADLVISETSAELQVVTDNPDLIPTALVVVGYDDACQLYARRANFDHVFLGRLQEPLANDISFVKTARWTIIDSISAIFSKEIGFHLIGSFSIRPYFLRELAGEWDAYCNANKLDMQTRGDGASALHKAYDEFIASNDGSAFPALRNFNVFIDGNDAGDLLNEVARQPLGGLAGRRSSNAMDSFVKSLLLRQ